MGEGQGAQAVHSYRSASSTIDSAVASSAGTGPAARGPITAESKLMAAARDAVEVLVQLGHTKPAAREMVERVIARDDAPTDATAESIVELALR
ncbi:MAG: hypothetical protein ACKOTD_05850 [Phycisphaerales bacterium]